MSQRIGLVALLLILAIGAIVILSTQIHHEQNTRSNASETIGANDHVVPNVEKNGLTMVESQNSATVGTTIQVTVSGKAPLPNQSQAVLFFSDDEANRGKSMPLSEAQKSGTPGNWTYTFSYTIPPVVSSPDGTQENITPGNGHLIFTFAPSLETMDDHTMVEIPITITQ